MRWKSHVRFGGRAGETNRSKQRHGAPTRSHVAQRCLDSVRRRVQNETLGHRGRKDDPLYKVRKVLPTGDERLTSTGRTRLLEGLRLGDPHDEVLGAWLAKEMVRDVYLTEKVNLATVLSAGPSRPAWPMTCPRFRPWDGPCGSGGPRS